MFADVTSFPPSLSPLIYAGELGPDCLEKIVNTIQVHRIDVSHGCFCVCVCVCVRVCVCECAVVCV